MSRRHEAMTDSRSADSDAAQTWTRLVQDTLSRGGAARPGDQDPWLTLIDQLWKANPFSRLLPIDPAEMTAAFQQIWQDAMHNPGRAWVQYTDFVQQYTRIMAEASLRFWSGQQAGSP